MSDHDWEARLYGEIWEVSNSLRPMRWWTVVNPGPDAIIYGATGRPVKPDGALGQRILKAITDHQAVG